MDIKKHRNISDLYNSLNLPLQQDMDFTIHFLPSIHIDLPFQSPLFRSEYYSFLFVKDGNGSYTIDDQTFQIKPNTFYFTNPGHIRSFNIETCDDVYLLTVNEAFLIKHLESSLYNQFPFLLAEITPPIYFNEEEFSKLGLIVKSIYNEFQNSERYKNEILAKLFYSVLLKIKAKYYDNKDLIKLEDQNSTVVNEFKKRLDSEFKNLINSAAFYIPMNSQEYANEIGLHPNYFNTVIKAKTGKTANDWIQSRTVLAAKSLLKNTSLSAKEIAFKMGYKEATHFSRFFKKMTDQSPLEYRKSVHS